MYKSWPSERSPAQLYQPRSEQAVPHVLQLLDDLCWCPVELTGNETLLVSRQGHELLAKITIHAILDWEVVGSVRDVVAATEWGFLRAHEHLQVREEVDFFAAGEGVEGADGAQQRGEANELGTALRQGRLLKRCDGVANVELHDVLQLWRSACEVGGVRLEAEPGEVAAFVVPGLLGHASDEEVVELVGTGHGDVVQHRRAGDPARHRVVRHHEELVVGATVLEDVERLPEISRIDLVVLDVHPHDPLWDILVLALTQQLPLAKLVDAQRFANAGQQPSLEGKQAKGHVIQRCGVNELQVIALIIHVSLDRGLWRVPRIQRHVVHSSNHQAGLIGQLGEVAHCQAKCRLIDVQVELEDWGQR
mmetsp:Transcript_1925/g.3674  ORF Transcript_1925/g.3674 Transcript_1925/m.3674 type:complete len:363 (+) Transcript_1925:282-1370(+)